ncbi:glycine cleavage system aminomethyltransferase GcvT [Aestuariimicrobium kwangyangense]|uniref:glycine cleavage system aminomethyltransferase GcvT n=1 Tax=Aestuariimicrobium kwangyangense TaxID=396389 RepID=UPI0003B6EAB9|nr:glycine cleavage system aminomethyltransferase GcvT [Aestuariimicrobium kwangyangense]
MPELKHSPLHDRHVTAGAKFAEFGGWEMPLEYLGGGVLAEHRAVREGVGIFDVSHLGKATVTGPGAREFLNHTLTNDLDRIVPGKAQYSMLCNTEGGVVDDLICYLKGDDEVFLIPNAANTAEVCRILTGLASSSAEYQGVEVTNRHDDYAVLAVQGPHSDEVLEAMGLPSEFDYMGFTEADHDGVTYTVCRTGYTGEKGYELVVPSEIAPGVWDEVMRVGEPFGIRPCGLGARDTLRTEMGYSLHGLDISPGINPVEAGLSWAIGWKKPYEFEGSVALRRVRDEGPARRMRGLRAIGRGIPRHGMSVVDAEGAVLGEVTSGTFSPTLRYGVGLALLDASVELGDTVWVVVRNRREEFEVVKPPFVTPGVRAA